MQYWAVVNSITPAERVAKLERDGHANRAIRFEYVNLPDVMRRLREVLDFEMEAHESWDAAGIAFRAIPKPVLRITDPDFRQDYFYVSQEFMSERLRTVIGLGPDVIAYREVDTTLSTPAVQEQRYNMFYIVHRANPFDARIMKGHIRPVRQEDGSLRDEWLPDPPPPGPNSPIYEIQFADDFVPPASIFRTVGSNFTLATDEFAERVMRAGITDMAFMRIDGVRQPNAIVWRQLR